jgi:hypothetical protein
MSQNWAICIGIDRYDNLQPLQYAKRDAEALRDFFEKEAGFDKVYFFAEDAPQIPTDFAEAIRSIRRAPENAGWAAAVCDAAGDIPAQSVRALRYARQCLGILPRQGGGKLRRRAARRHRQSCGPEESERILRGGSWSHNPAICRSAYRDSIAPGDPGLQGRIGFRVACTA